MFNPSPVKESIERNSRLATDCHKTNYERQSLQRPGFKKVEGFTEKWKHTDGQLTGSYHHLGAAKDGNTPGHNSSGFDHIEVKISTGGTL